MTTFYEIYELFLREVIDIYFVDYETEDISYDDLQNILYSAIIKFKHPKKDIRDIDLEYMNDDGVVGKFNIELDLEEKEILVGYMGIKWAENKLKRGRITELQYTGSDAKVINIKTYIEGIKVILDTLTSQVKILNNNYHSHTGYKLELNEKNTVNRRNILRNR